MALGRTSVYSTPSTRQPSFQEMTPQQKRNTVVSRVFAFAAVAAFAVVFAVGHFHSMSVAAHVGMGVGAAGAVAASAAVAHFFAQHRYKDKDSHKGSVQSS